MTPVNTGLLVAGCIFFIVIVGTVVSKTLFSRSKRVY